MKAIKILLLIVTVAPLKLLAGDDQEAAKAHFYRAKERLENMLSGKEHASYEEAIYTIENAWWEGGINYASFKTAIDFRIARIQSIMNVNRDNQKMNPAGDLLQSKEIKILNYEKALKNYAIYEFMTQSTLFFDDDMLLFHPAYSYSYRDPLATMDWRNTQVTSLINSKEGNCFALTSLFKILSDRLGAEAKLCTAPGHIYIRHANDKGVWYNVELSSNTFPGTGTIETITHSPLEAVKNNIALRELDQKQSIALCLVYLAKGYEYKFGVKEDAFMLACAETALQYDDHNLNAMLLKAEILEERLVRQNKEIEVLQKQNEFQEYEKWITRIFDLGYREMPFEMKNLLVQGWTRDTIVQLKSVDNTASDDKESIPKTRYASLSWGLFDEKMRTKPVERFGRTAIDSRTRKIIALVADDVLYNQYNFDPVVFAWSVDPLAHKYPGISPYTAFADNPIMFKDRGGAYVEGMDGKPVTYEMLTNGKIKWSANASADVQRIGNAMLKTATGQEQFAKMQKTAYPIGVHLNKPNDGDFGKTDADIVTDAEGNRTVRRVDVYVNTNVMAMWKNRADAAYKDVKDLKKVLKENIEATKDPNAKASYQTYLLMLEGKVEEVVGSTGSHEAEHATNPQNLNDWKDNEENKGNPNCLPNDVEEAPTNIERKELDERSKTQ